MAAAPARKKKSKSGHGWSWRLAGIALCAFFVLGVITGLSPSGRLLARRIEALLGWLPRAGRSQLIPAAYQTLRGSNRDSSFIPASAPANPDQTSGAIALVEHSDGFYQLDSSGELTGPTSPIGASDLPVLSGAGVENAGAPLLVEYAGLLVRAEAVLSAMVSEMRVEANGTATLFLDRPHLSIRLAPSHVPLQLARAGQVLELWHGRRDLIGTIDMTTPGEAVLHPRPGLTDIDSGGSQTAAAGEARAPTPHAMNRAPRSRVSRAAVWKVNATVSRGGGTR